MNLFGSPHAFALISVTSCRLQEFCSTEFFGNWKFSYWTVCILCRMLCHPNSIHILAGSALARLETAALSQKWYRYAKPKQKHYLPTSNSGAPKRMFYEKDVLRILCSPSVAMVTRTSKNVGLNKRSTSYFYPTTWIHPAHSCANLFNINKAAWY